MGAPEVDFAPPPRRQAAVAFIFITVVLDVLAMGIIIPVLPRLVQDFLGGDAARAAIMFGVFGTVWSAMQFFCSPIIGMLSDRYGRRRVILLSNFRTRSRLHRDGARANARLAVCRPGDFRNHGRELDHCRRVHRRRHA